ncbi:MAG TPA: efflux transporter outer membrane subunit, partial [Burkholderiales bacterium]|nr:efflux transporter outer membrane subunit [Burkholderiales bacterium]
MRAAGLSSVASLPRGKSGLIRRASSLAAALCAAACTVGPNYTRPQIDAPQGWRVEYEQAAEVANTRWWQAFDDPALDQLVDTTVRENLDVRIAAARVDQFLGALNTTRSQFYPQFDYSAEASRNRATAVGATALPPGADRDYSLYTAALGATWQIDLFGRVRRQSEAAQARVYASEQGRRGVILSVVTSVASAYVGLRGLDEQLDIARRTADNYAQTLKLFELRFKGGVVSDVELAQIRSQYEQALATIPSIERQIAVQENLISILLGRNPGAIPRGKRIAELAQPRIPGGLPASLLERRPDLLQAEQALRAANAEIGVAKSLYYPTLSLTGVLGLASTSLDDFVSSDATTGYVAAGLFGPIFTFGRIEGQVLTAEAAQQEALAFYRQTVLNAFRETNDALVGTQKTGEQYAALARRAAALREYARLSRLRFDAGAASYLEVLYAENELFGAELSAVGALSDRYAEVINVYKAMGGGWVDLADPLAPAAGGEAVPVASAAAEPDMSDRMASGQENGAFVLNVYRVRGIGGAMLKRPAQGWPQAIVVRLHGFPELEGFTAKSAGGTLQCALQRPAGQPPVRVCTLGSDRVAALRAEASMFEVTLPADMLRTDSGSIELRW